MEKNWIVLDTEVVPALGTGQHSIYTYVYGPYQEADAFDIAHELNKDGQTTACAMKLKDNPED